MLGYYALLHVLIGWFGDGAFVIRLPSVIASGAAAGAVALLGLRLFDRRVALAAGLLTAVSLPLVFWGQDARGYAAMVALVAGSFVAFAAIVDGPRRRGAVDRVRRPDHAVGVRELRRDLRAARAAGRARVAHGRAGAAVRLARSRRARCAGSRSRCWRSAAGRASCSGSRRPNLKLEKQVIARAHLGRLRAELPPDRRSARRLAIVTVALLLVAAVRIVRRRAVGTRCWRCRGWSSRSG